MTRLSYNKVCNVEDFADPELRRVMRRELPHEVARFGAAYPSGHEDRKDWETAMAIRAFEDHGLLDGEHDFLGVAAGIEALIYCLTRYARRVFATDLYLDPGVWSITAPVSMLQDPGRYWPSDWNPRRLVLQHMNALDLLYEDESFDGVFSSSSIEHFGDYGALERGMDEIFRILRPGGIAALSTEYRVSGPSPGMPGTLMFDRDEIAQHLIGDRPWKLVSPLDLTVSDETVRTAADLPSILEWQSEAIEQQGGLGAIHPEYPQYPMVALKSSTGHTFTSMHIVLRKKRRNLAARILPRPALAAGRNLRDSARKAWSGRRPAQAVSSVA
jgi:SAM-dependent methyltransferase